MDFVSIHDCSHEYDGKPQYSIHYHLDNPVNSIIFTCDSIIFKGHCEYYGISPNIKFGTFSFNVTNAPDCDVVMFNIPYETVYRIASNVAHYLGVMLNINEYEYR